MNKIKFFIIVVVIIILENIIPLFFNVPLILFSIFIISYIIDNERSANRSGGSDFQDKFLPVIFAAFVFDLFSGFKFGILALSFLILFLLIFWLGKFLDIRGRSFAGNLVRVTLLFFIFLFIQVALIYLFNFNGLSYSGIISGVLSFFSFYPVLLAEILIVFIITHRFMLDSNFSSRFNKHG